jgi:hypothetical protein
MLIQLMRRFTILTRTSGAVSTIGARTFSTFGTSHPSHRSHHHP